MPRIVLTALINLGNTCYMNSAVQALFATNEFREYLLKINYCDKKLHSSLSKLFKDMTACGELEDMDCVSPKLFRDVFTEIKTDFNNHNQHDSQEFLKLLIDGLHEEVNEAKDRKRPENLCEPKSPKEAWIQYKQFMDDSFLVKLFVGQLCSTIKCIECDNKSQCWESFWDICVSIPEKENQLLSVRELIKVYIADEVLNNDSMPTCSHCQTKTKSIKSMKIERLPLILTINVKRFGNDGQKVSKCVSVDQTLYLNAIPYDLYACVCHKGESAGGGHYSIYCRYYSANWYHFDDNSIEMININSNTFSEAYILFYHMKDVSIKF